MYEPADILKLLQCRFEKGDVANFRRFVKRHPGQRRWLITSDYNWGTKDYPQDVLAFTVYPAPNDIVQLSKELDAIFPKDFKKARNSGLSKQVVGWFRRKSDAFHICVVLENKTSIFRSHGQEPSESSRNVIDKTLVYVESSAVPAWVLFDLEKLKQKSRSKGFNSVIFSDICLLSCVYSFVVGILLKENKVESIEWCSDRDSRTEWNDGYLNNLAHIFGTQVASRIGQSLRTEQLPIRVLSDRNKEVFDPIIRPPDYLAGPLASWNFEKSGSVKSTGKYTDIYSSVLVGNRNISIIRLIVGESDMKTSSVRFQRE